MSKRSAIYLIVAALLVICVGHWMHHGGAKGLRSWMIAIHGKH